MLEREFYHLPNLLELVSNSSDILVGDGLNHILLFLVNAILLDHYLSIRKYLHYPLGTGLYYSKRQCFGEECHPWNEYSISCNNWPLVQATSCESFNSGPKPNFLLLCHYWAQDQFGARLDLDFADLCSVSKTYSGVFPNYPVNSNNSKISIFWSASPNNSRSLPLTFDLYDVSGF